MTLHLHTLSGCAPTPLAHYLKALGVLRLVAEQKDQSARGWWRDETFHVVTTLYREELEHFFLDEYQPTPLVTPWNGGSGFYKNWDPKARRFRESVAFNSLARLETSTAARFEPYRRCIRVVREVIRECSSDVDVSNLTPKELDSLLLVPPTSSEGAKGIDADSGKGELIRRVYHAMPSDLRAFFESVFAITVRPEPTGRDGILPIPPPIWGTGGNDGKMEFANNQMRRLLDLFDGTSGKAANGSERLLAAALWRETVPLTAYTQPRQKDDKERSIGMFLPSDVGGANMTVGFSADSQFNLWDYVLMLEGAVAFATNVSRRVMTGHLSSVRATAPFSMLVDGIGSGSISLNDERTKKSIKAEQWMPLWSRPASWRELRSLIAEGRCQLGRALATRPAQVGQAIARLGVARGLSEFVRVAFIERNGQSNLATPLGRWRVPQQPRRHQELLGDICAWVERLKSASTDKKAIGGKAAARAANICENAILACSRDEAGPARWQQLLVALGKAESQLVRSPRFTADKGLQPLGAFSAGLSAGWLRAVNDRSPELRLALAMASQHGVRPRRQGSRTTIEIDWSNPVRRHFLPLEDTSEQGWAPRKFAAVSEKLRDDPAVVCDSGDLERDAIGLIHRRIVEGRQRGTSVLPLQPVPGAEASLADILKFINGELDPARILGLARPLMALDWADYRRSAVEFRAEFDWPCFDEECKAADALAIYGVVRLCHHGDAIAVPLPSRKPGPILAGDAYRPTSEVCVRLDPCIFPRLASGQVQHAVQLAVRRLAVSGLRPKVTVAVATAAAGRRLAAALAFPIGWSGAQLLATRLTRPSFKPGDPAPGEQAAQGAMS